MRGSQNIAITFSTSNFRATNTTCNKTVTGATSVIFHHAKAAQTE